MTTNRKNLYPQWTPEHGAILSWDPFDDSFNLTDIRAIHWHNTLDTYNAADPEQTNPPDNPNKSHTKAIAILTMYTERTPPGSRAKYFADIHIHEPNQDTINRLQHLPQSLILDYYNIGRKQQ